MQIQNNTLEKGVMTELAKRVKDYRISQNMTQKELAEKSYISEGTLKRFENGSEISLSNFIKILKALGLSQNFDLLIPDQRERPSFYAEDNAARRRVGKKRTKEPEWEWGDGE